MKGATDSYARTLFGVAALANFSVTFGLLLLRPQVTPLLRLDPIAGSNLAFFHLAATLIAIFGYAYLRVALDPRRFRPFVGLGAIGKVLAVATATWHWLAGDLSWPLPLLISGDLVFAVLFVDYLRRTRAA